MWEKIVIVSPVKRRWNVKVSLTGAVLTQELNATQQRTVLAQGATYAEYAALVREHETTAFLADMEASAEPTFRHGYDAFNVQVSGRRPVPVMAEPTRDTPTDLAGSYTYLPADQALT